jgi:putative transposase
MADVTMPGMDVIRKQLVDGDGDLLRELVSGVVAALMSAEADAICGATYGERSPERVNSRNGYRPRRWDTRAGTIDLEIPRLREGSYYPHWLLEPRSRSERALVSVVADLYLAGVSTRRVDKVVRQLGIQGMSKSQVSRLAGELDEIVEGFRTRPLDMGPYPYLMVDALVVKVREGGRIVNVCVCHATAVNTEGYRESLGSTSSPRRTAPRGWASCAVWSRAACRGCSWSPQTRIPASWTRSEARCRERRGSGAARTSCATCSPACPSRPQPAVATLVRSIFAQPDHDQVDEQYQRVCAQLAERFPAAADLLEDAKPDLLSFAAYPKPVWKQIWSTNPLERLNREIRRRTDVVSIFPDRAAAIRLIGAVLAEQHEESLTSERRYLSLDVIVTTRRLIEPQTPEVVDVIAA